MHNPESILENEIHKILWPFKIQMDHQISAKRPDQVIVYNKKRTCQIVDFAIPADHRVKLKKSEKSDKYLDLARTQKIWNMKVTMIPIVISALGTVTKGLKLEVSKIRVQVETIQTTALLKSVRILRRALET